MNLIYKSLQYLRIQKSSIPCTNAIQHIQTLMHTVLKSLYKTPREYV